MPYNLKISMNGTFLFAIVFPVVFLFPIFVYLLYIKDVNLIKEFAYGLIWNNS